MTGSIPAFEWTASATTCRMPTFLVSGVDRCGPWPAAPEAGKLYKGPPHAPGMRLLQMGSLLILLAAGSLAGCVEDRSLRAETAPEPVESGFPTDFVVGSNASFMAWTTTAVGPVFLEITVDTHGHLCEYRAAAVTDTSNGVRYYQAGVRASGYGMYHRQWPAAVWTGPVDSRVVGQKGLYEVYSATGVREAGGPIVLFLMVPQTRQSVAAEHTGGGSAHVELECEGRFDVVAISESKSGFEVSENSGQGGTGVYVQGFASHVEGVVVAGHVHGDRAQATFEGSSLIQAGTLSVETPDGTTEFAMPGPQWATVDGPAGAWSVRVDRSAVLGGAGSLYGRVIGWNDWDHLESALSSEPSGTVEDNGSYIGVRPVH